MYLQYFGLTEAPFSIAPDPRYLYMSKRHQEALAHLLFGLRGDGGFVVLTGEVGAGKTTVCRCLLEQVPDDCDLAYVFNPKLSAEELLATLCTEFRIALPPGPHSVKQLVDAINDFLLAGHANGRHAVLIIDEAQNLSPDVLEQMRLLTNLETHQRKLLQIILIGQPELAPMLQRPQLRQLAQRVVARYHLDSLRPEEVAAYVQHRLEVAGAPRLLIPTKLTSSLYRLSDGVPRILNLLCDRALLGAYVEGKPAVDQAILQRAAREVFPVQQSPKRASGRWLMAGGGAVALGVLIGAIGLYRTSAPSAAKPHSSPTTVATAASQHKEKPLMAAAPTVVVPSIDWPAAPPHTAEPNEALTALYRAWGETVPEDSLCGVSGELRCRTTRGGLDELRALNRPVVLYLSARDGQPMEGLLTALGAQAATIQLAGQTLSMPISDLALHWAGRYTMLWRTPNPPVEQLRTGDSGPAVAWLADHLASVNGQSPKHGETVVFDEAMRGLIRQFQLSHGLAPDGQVGLQTLIRLSLASDANAPALQPASR